MVEEQRALRVANQLRCVTRHLTVGNFDTGDYFVHDFLQRRYPKNRCLLSRIECRNSCGNSSTIVRVGLRAVVDMALLYRTRYALNGARSIFKEELFFL